MNTTWQREITTEKLEELAAGAAGRATKVPDPDTTYGPMERAEAKATFEFYSALLANRATNE